MEDLALKNILLNRNKKTCFHRPDMTCDVTFTAIDLTLCRPSLFFTDFSWEVGLDPCGSDHFPIFWTMTDHHLLKGFRDGGWQRQTGISFSVCAALDCSNQVEGRIGFSRYLTSSRHIEKRRQFSYRNR